jgi:putative endonuclease
MFMGIFYVYILKCTNKKDDISLYTGSTKDLMQRVEEHRTGKGAKYTRGKKIELAYFETLLTRSEAMKREYEIKTFSSTKKWKIIKEFQHNNK